MNRAEVWNGKVWVPQTAEQATKLGKRKFRCVECHGAAGFFREGTNGQAAHFEHRRRDENCSLCHVAV